MPYTNVIVGLNVFRLLTYYVQIPRLTTEVAQKSSSCQKCYSFYSVENMKIWRENLILFSAEGYFSVTLYNVYIHNFRSNRVAVNGGSKPP